MHISTSLVIPNSNVDGGIFENLQRFLGFRNLTRTTILKKFSNKHVVRNYDTIRPTKDPLKGSQKVDSSCCESRLLEKQEGDIRQTLWNATDRRKLAFAKSLIFPRRR